MLLQIQQTTGVDLQLYCYTQGDTVRQQTNGEMAIR